MTTPPQAPSMGEAPPIARKGLSASDSQPAGRRSRTPAQRSAGTRPIAIVVDAGQFAGVGALLDHAECIGASQVWIAPASVRAAGWPALLTTPPRRMAFFEDCAGWSTYATGPAHHSYWWRRGGDGIDLIVPCWAPPDAESPFAHLGTGELARASRRLLEASHGLIRWKGTATITSDALVRSTTRGLVPGTRPDFGKYLRGGEGAFAWRAAPGAGPAQRFCYAFDLNLAYLNGASSVSLGVGELHHVRPLGRTLPAPQPNAPGWYRIEVPSWDEATLPAPWLEQGMTRGDAGRWVTLPTARLAVELGANVIEAHLFEDGRRHLDRWYKCLRDARSTLLAERGPAYLAVKQIAQHGLGRMGSTKRRQALDRDPLYQPYWREAVIAEMRTRLFRRLQKLRRYPVAIDVDCCYFLTNAKTPEAFAEWVGLPLGDGLGQFKVAGAIRGTEARLELAKGTRATLENLGRAMREAAA